MKITIEDKKKKDIFISIFSLLKNASSQINASFDLDKLHIQGMDKSHVCLFNLNLKNNWFTSYEVSEKRDICFDTNIFYSMISSKSDEQNLIIKINSDDSLDIELVNSVKKNDYNKYFAMPLIEYEYDEMNIPSTDYDAELSLPSKKVTDMLSQLSNFGDDLNVKCGENDADFSTKGNAGEMRVNIPIDDMSSYSIVEGELINLTYSLIYISKMCVSNKLSADIDFSLSNEYPMKIKYDLGDESELLFYIAPKLEDA